mgnify:CR=1 FL=1
MSLKDKLAVLPNQPGCYLMKDKYGDVIYVGKAKVLRNRVRSYFTGSHDRKTQHLVSEIKDFEYIVTSSDLDALLLELTLIKKHNPKYNVMFKDDKSYPYIKITAEEHPRLIITRKLKKDKGKYFGPYPNAFAAQETKKLLDRIFPLRKCRTIPKEVCLYYHIDQCLAPCVNDVPKEETEKMVEGISRFLSGSGYESVKRELREKMEKAAEQLNFEKAKEYRDQIQHIEKVMEKQKIFLNDRTDGDVFGYAYDKGWMCVQVFFIRQGKLIERDVSLFPFYKAAEEDFLTFIGSFYLQKNHPIPKEIFIPKSIDKDLVSQLLNTKVHQPQIGKKKDLVALANKNAKIALSEKFALIERDEERTIKAVERLGAVLNIDTPHRIEAFDNSNIQGADPVSAMVVFTDGKPDKKEYRKYKIRTVEGPDDYATMREVVRRRYTRLLKENSRLPDLIIVDGGKGQLSAAKDVLENELGLSIPIAGLVKDENHRSSHLIMGDPPREMKMKRNSQEFYLLQRIQDEVHRFAITFHRSVRGKSMLKSSLDEIPGIGPKRKQKLLAHFGSVKNMKKATEEQFIEAGMPRNVAANLAAHFNRES